MSDLEDLKEFLDSDVVIEGNTYAEPVRYLISYEEEKDFDFNGEPVRVVDFVEQPLIPQPNDANLGRRIYHIFITYKGLTYRVVYEYDSWDSPGIDLDTLARVEKRPVTREEWVEV